MRAYYIMWEQLSNQSSRILKAWGTACECGPLRPLYVHLAGDKCFKAFFVCCRSSASSMYWMQTEEHKRERPEKEDWVSVFFSLRLNQEFIVCTSHIISIPAFYMPSGQYDVGDQYAKLWKQTAKRESFATVLIQLISTAFLYILTVINSWIKFCVDQPRIYRIYKKFVLTLPFLMFQSPVLGQDITSRASIFFVRHCHPVCPPRMSHYWACNKISQAFLPPFFFYTVKRSKTLRWEGLGTRLQD